ncbi:MAG TPA: glycosyltransferase family 2 protein, partial [Nonomuraea sp.]|nr:glycosyltransferase family 2 protein [Nonomuraea sp.]
TLMNVRAAKAGLKVHEVPSHERNRIHGESNLHAVRDGFRVLKTILKEWKRPAASPKPEPKATPAADRGVA